MRLADIEQGTVYAAVFYYRPDHHGRAVVHGRDWNAAVWEKLWHDLYPVLVLEKPVTVGHYSTPGVLVRRIDPQTGEHLRWAFNGELAEDEAMRAVSLLMPWDEWTDLYLGRMQAHEDAAARRREEHDAVKRARQEAAAKDWMKREFASARRCFEQMATLGKLPEGFDDGDVRALVELREPDGNPYLNGTHEVH